MDTFWKDFMMLWSTIDPIGTLALFTGLTAHLSQSQKRQVALKAAGYAFTILISALIVGQIILKALDIQLISLQLAGGIILFLFGLQMIFVAPEKGSNAGSEEAGHQLAVFPLAVPSIASPGAIMAVIVLTDNSAKTFAQQASTAFAMTCVVLITCGFMLVADRIFKVIGHNGSAILIRVMGMILAALSVELVMTTLGVSQWMG